MNPIYMTPTHEWIRLENDHYTLGITDHAQQLLGDLVFVELPKVGQSFIKGETLGVLESVKAASDFYAPISGVVTAVNALLNDNPGVINQDPFGQGWLIQLSATAREELATLMDEATYQQTLD